MSELEAIARWLAENPGQRRFSMSADRHGAVTLQLTTVYRMRGTGNARHNYTAMERVPKADIEKVITPAAESILARARDALADGSMKEVRWSARE